MELEYVLNKLKRGLSDEEETLKVYQSQLPGVDNSDVKPALTGIIEDEKNHVKTLKGLISRIEGGEIEI